jgi:hypothetical protein
MPTVYPAFAYSTCCCCFAECVYYLQDWIIFLRAEDIVVAAWSLEGNAQTLHILARVEKSVVSVGRY